MLSTIRKDKVPFILGTDWWSDCDDCMALRLLCWAHKQGYIDFKGVVINACMQYSVPSVVSFLRLEKVDIPVGIDINATDFHGIGRYQKKLANRFSDLPQNEDVLDGVTLYRKLLAESDKKVEIAEIGFTQVLADLLDSPADEYSPLTGIELVREKCEKLWVMAGKWDNLKSGKEHNFCNNQRSINGGIRLCKNWPTEIVFLGFEIGFDVISGGNLKKEDFLHVALADNICPLGRSSWDPMLVLLALVNDFEKAGYEYKQGTASLDDDGANHFVFSDDGKHRFVIKTHRSVWYKNRINEILADDYKNIVK
ncbi:MAG: hypothetical protein IJA31_09045 [Clostridia bacterium]|nr:hypothetical protein [Clostridia bacterium]